jgi:hypothetical protein
MSNDLTEVQKIIAEVCDTIKDMLIEKNKSYGSSFSDPVRIFSKVETDEQINVRIDDKLSRIKNHGNFAGDNDLDDLAGYIILKKVYRAVKERGL